MSLIGLDGKIDPIVLLSRLNSIEHEEATKLLVEVKGVLERGTTIDELIINLAITILRILHFDMNRETLVNILIKDDDSLKSSIKAIKPLIEAILHNIIVQAEADDYMLYSSSMETNTLPHTRLSLIIDNTVKGGMGAETKGSSKR